MYLPHRASPFYKGGISHSLAGNDTACIPNGNGIGQSTKNSHGCQGCNKLGQMKLCHHKSVKKPCCQSHQNSYQKHHPDRKQGIPINVSHSHAYQSHTASGRQINTRCKNHIRYSYTDDPCNRSISYNFQQIIRIQIISAHAGKQRCQGTQHSQ